MNDHTGKYPLTISDAMSIGTILDMAASCAKVARVDDNMPDGIVYGHARCVGTENGNRYSDSDNVDVRDMWLRVTLRSGFEAFWRISDLIPLVESREFVTYDW